MAYEEMTYEFILNRMIDRVSKNYPNLDVREGSMIFNALSPEAFELAIAYTELDNTRKESFIETASRDGKLLLCASQGIDITIFNASSCIAKAIFNVEIELNTKWALDLYNYTVTKYIGINELGDYEYQLTCDTTGVAPNGLTGTITPINYSPPGLNKSEITSIIINGENEKTDDEITKYYINNVNGTATDGNIEQYKQWCDKFNGIGNYKIFPLWDGNNTVKVSILNTENTVANPELIENFQNYLDPGKTGMGNGQAPIGAIVTVTTATEVDINITAKLTLATGYSNHDDVKIALEKYLSNIAYVKNTVSYIGIGSVIIDSPSVDNVTELLINGKQEDIVLNEEQIPKLGEVVWS